MVYGNGCNLLIPGKKVLSVRGLICLVLPFIVILELLLYGSFEDVVSGFGNLERLFSNSKGAGKLLQGLGVRRSAVY